MRRRETERQRDRETKRQRDRERAIEENMEGGRGGETDREGRERERARERQSERERWSASANKTSPSYASPLANRYACVFAMAVAAAAYGTLGSVGTVPAVRLYASTQSPTPGSGGRLVAGRYRWLVVVCGWDGVIQWWLVVVVAPRMFM